MKNLYSLALIIFALGLTTSCINEWPKTEELSYEINLIVHCDTDWIPNYYMTYSRTPEDEVYILYQFKVFRSGETSNPIKEFSIYSKDFSRDDFSLDLSLPAGTFDVYVWSDVCDAASGKSLFYDSSNFSAVTYRLPYKANNNYKDAFRGKESITIRKSDKLRPVETKVITLKRPLSRYIFMATDLNKFVENEISRGKMRDLASREGDYSSRDLEEELTAYSIKVVYPLYMPSVFDVFSNKPYDSWTGISFDGAINPIDNSTAELGMDYVMVNLDPSTVQVALQIYDNEGVLIGGTPTINVPILRDRTTIISGDFLTSQEDTGIVINPDFDGQYNIEYK